MPLRFCKPEVTGSIPARSIAERRENLLLEAFAPELLTVSSG